MSRVSVASSKPQPQPIASSSPAVKALPVQARADKSTVNPKAIGWNNQAVAKLSKADYKGSLAAFNRAIQIDPKLAEAYLGRGMVYSSLRNRPEALKNFNQAIKLDASFAEAYFNRADEYATMGKRKEAIADFDKAAQLYANRNDKANEHLARIRLEELKPPTVAVAPATQPTPNATNNPPLALALHLKQLGAKMYGTFWCSACHWQREQFGETAFSQINYVECDPGGTNSQAALCSQANIQGYPTWEIGGRLYPPGGFQLEDLADMSGYRGSRNFQESNN